MRSATLVSSLLLVAAGVAQAASSWSFDDATITVTSKGSSGKVQEKLDAKTPLAQAITIGSGDVAKLILTAKDNGKAKRPHQAFLLLQETESGLEAPFPLTIKESGKGVVQISQKDIPIQLLASSSPVRASIVIGSFGSAQAYEGAVFDIAFPADPNTPAPSAPVAERYGALPEIHHIFRADERQPPKFISFLFSAAIAVLLPALFVGWVVLGANANHISKALTAAPLSHAGFFGSILAIEGVFFLYYTRWTLFQVLPVATVLGAVAVLSGTKALGEVQARRLAGER